MKNKIYKVYLIALIIVLGLFLWTSANSQGWERYDYGIDHFVIDDRIHVFKIDQDYYSFKALGSKDTYKTLPEWVENERGGINLNMYVPGSGLGADPIGYAKIDGKVIQPRIKSDFNVFIVWDEEKLTILDRTEESMDSIMSWPNVSQNIRMMKRNINGKNRWTLQPKKWSVAALGTTVDGNVLLIHSRYPYQMHNFNNKLLAHLRRLRIDRLAYLEGGPESNLIVKGWKRQVFSQMGSYETGYLEDDSNTTFYTLPLVLTFNIKKHD